MPPVKSYNPGIVPNGHRGAEHCERTNLSLHQLTRGVAEPNIADGAPTLTVPCAKEPSEADCSPRMCAGLTRVDPNTQEEVPVGLDLRSFEQVSFRAQFDPAYEDDKAHYSVVLGCPSVIPNRWPTLVRAVDVSRSESLVGLSLASLAPGPHPIGFANLDGCLANVECVCFEPEDAGRPGTLTVDDLTLR